MSGFSESWLALREPYDRRARNAAVLDAVAAWAGERPSVAVVDLACGSRIDAAGRVRTPAAAPELAPGRQRSEPARPRGALAKPPDLTVTAVPVDLARDLEAALDGPVELVTTSALLDLVSHDWLDRLATESAARRLPVYAALSYDGLATLDPVDPLDSAMIEAVNEHQRGEKGLARRSDRRRPPPRPAASKRSAMRWRKGRQTGCSARAMPGFRPRCSPAGRSRRAKSAASSIGDIINWLARRRDHIAAGRSSMRVGHVDFFARPIATR